MDGSPAPTYRVNELTPDPAVTFDPKVVKDYVTYAHRIANRGLVNSSVGGMVIRVRHPSYPDGVTDKAVAFDVVGEVFPRLGKLGHFEPPFIWSRMRGSRTA